MLTSIITADLHLTDNPRDADRFNLFLWLAKQCKRFKADEVLILGDLTDAKDRHSAVLVNKIVGSLTYLANYARVYVLQGNHDFIQEGSPFFEFLNKVGIEFITQPTTFPDNKRRRFLPCTRNYQETWKDEKFDQYDYIFCHQTFNGCKAENGIELPGIPPSVFAGIKAKVISGDIHVPQRVSKNIEYVGSPYRIHFGDSFEPRCLLLQPGETATNLRYKGQGRELIEVSSVEALHKFAFDIGTQVKIRVRLRRKDYPSWPNTRAQITELAARRGWELCGLELETIQQSSVEMEREEMTSADPGEVLSDYASRKKLKPDLKKIGKQILDEARGD